MYEIRCIVGDKKLREVLVFLNDNNTLEPPVVIPTVPDVPENLGSKTVPVKHPQNLPSKKRLKKPIQKGGKHLKGKGSTQIIRSFIERTGTTRISARDMKRVTVDVGYSPNAYSHAVKLLLADKTIHRVNGLAGYYDVVKPNQTYGEHLNG